MTLQPEVRSRQFRYACSPDSLSPRKKHVVHIAVAKAIVAYDDEEHVEGIRCIAAPVFNYSGQAMASICTVGAKSRMTRQKLRALRDPLLDFAKTLSERLGWAHESGAMRELA